MVEVLVDDSLIDELSIREGTVEEALRHVQSTHCGAGGLVVSVRCDGLEIPPNAMAETFVRKVASIQRLEVFTGTKAQLVRDAMSQASTCLTETQNVCKEAAALLIQGKIDQGRQALGECLSVWQQIHEALAKSLVMLELDTDACRVDGQPLVELFQKPKEVLLEVRTALESNDPVMLADLLQYEFPEVTRIWHDLISHLQQQAEENEGSVEA